MALRVAAWVAFIDLLSAKELKLYMEHKTALIGTYLSYYMYPMCGSNKWEI